MRLLLRLYDGLIVGLAYISAAMLVGVCIAIIYDVAVRNLGFQPPAAVSALTEYSLLFVTMGGSPWLVRTGGHVAINSFVRFLPAALTRRLGAAIIVVCIALCLGLAWYAFGMARVSFARGDIDIRSIDLPRWILFFSLMVGFLLIAIEFARLLVRGERIAELQEAGEGL